MRARRKQKGTDMAEITDTIRQKIEEYRENIAADIEELNNDFMGLSDDIDHALDLLESQDMFERPLDDRTWLSSCIEDMKWMAKRLSYPSGTITDIDALRCDVSDIEYEALQRAAQETEVQAASELSYTVE